ncbi:TPR repeat family protein [Brugia pahangi]
MVIRLWKYPLIKTCIAGGLGYLTFGMIDSVDSCPMLDDNEKWRKYRSDFYEFYFKFVDIVGKRHYIEEQYQQNIPNGSYLRCAIDSLEKAHQIIRFDSDDRLRRKILRKAHRYAIKAVTVEQNEDLRVESHKWYGLIMLKRAKYGNKEKRLLKSINELEKALVIDSIDPQIWYYLGIANYELGEYQNAVECHLRAMKLKQSDCPQNQYHLGLAQKQLNTPKSRVDACNAFKQVLTKHCDSVADTVIRRAALRECHECKEYL